MNKLFLYSLVLFTSHAGYCQGIADDSTLQKLRIKLEAIADRDQVNRTKSNMDQMYAMQYKYGTKSKEYQYICDLITANDSINQLEIVPIIDKYGWLGKSQVGNKANDAIFFVVHHSNNQMRSKYIPLMRVSVAKGESSEFYLHWLEDRILRDQDLPTKYHTQYFDVPRKDGTVDHYERRVDANEELKKEGLDTIAAASQH